MCPIIDNSDGWLVIDVQKLKDAIAKLPVDMQKLSAIKKCTGICTPQLSEYLSGKRNPDLKNFKKLCIYAQISADELLCLRNIDLSATIPDSGK